MPVPKETISRKQLITYEKKDMTLQEIANIYSISRERVRQLFTAKVGRPKKRSDRRASYKRLKILKYGMKILKEDVK